MVTVCGKCWKQLQVGLILLSIDFPFANVRITIHTMILYIAYDGLIIEVYGECYLPRVAHTHVLMVNFVWFYIADSTPFVYHVWCMDTV